MSQWENVIRHRQWQQGLSSLEMLEITHKTVGIVGLGHVGLQVAQRLKGFDTRTIYYDIDEIPMETQEKLDVQPVPLEQLFEESDIVTLHVPLTRSTRGLVSHRLLELMKPTAYLINTSRGQVVDEKALYQALKEKRIAGAALDVMEQEPPSKDNLLLQLDNIIITPHLAGSSLETFLRAADFAYSNIERVLAGKPPQSVVTAED